MTLQGLLQVAALLGGAAATGAIAHGDDHGDAARPAFDPARVEDTAFGREGDPKKVARTIRIEMSDAMRFAPAAITVKRGQTVRLVATNKGRVLHELVLGTPQDLQRHAELMRRFPDMEHAEPHMTHVKPGRSGAIVWQFTRAGSFGFACLIPGHFESGMVGTLTVE